MKPFKSTIGILSTILYAHTIQTWGAQARSGGPPAEEKERQAQYEVKAAAAQQAVQAARTTSSSSTSSVYTLPRCINEPLARVGNSSSLFNVGGKRMPAALSKYEISKWLPPQDLVEPCAIINQAMQREGRKDEWLLPTGQIIRLPYRQGTFKASFTDIVASADGKLLAITNAEEDNDDEAGAAHETVSITILDAQSGEAKQTLTATAFGDHVHDMTFSHDNSFLIARACTTGAAYLWNVSTGNLVKTLRATAENIKSCAFSPDGKLILTGSDNGSSQLWKIDSEEEPLMLQIAEEQIEREIFSPDGSFVVTKSQENWIHLWDVKALLSGETNPIQRFPHWGEIASVFNKDGSQFLTQLDDGTITV